MVHGQASSKSFFEHTIHFLWQHIVPRLWNDSPSCVCPEQLLPYSMTDIVMQLMRQQLRLKDLPVRYGVLHHYSLEDRTANQSYG